MTWKQRSKLRTLASGLCVTALAVPAATTYAADDTMSQDPARDNTRFTDDANEQRRTATDDHKRADQKRQAGQDKDKQYERLSDRDNKDRSQTQMYGVSLDQRQHQMLQVENLIGQPIYYTSQTHQTRQHAQQQGQQASEQQSEQKIGTLKDVVINTRTGEVAYGVISSEGGMLDSDHELYAVPWNTLHFSGADQSAQGDRSQQSDQTRISASIDKQKLDQAEGFDNDNWPDMADRQWEQDTRKTWEDRAQWQTSANQSRYDYEDGLQGDEMYGRPLEKNTPDDDDATTAQAGDQNERDRTAAANEQGDAQQRQLQAQRDNQRQDQQDRQAQRDNQRQGQQDRLTQRDDQRQDRQDQQLRMRTTVQKDQIVRASKLIDSEVENRQGEAVGTLTDIVVTDRGRAAYAIVNADELLDGNKQMVAVPFRSIEHQGQDKALIVNAQKQKLQSNAFAKGQEPDFSDQQWAQNLHRDFGQDRGYTVLGYSSVYVVPNDAWSAQSDYNRQYDAKQSKDISGTIQKIESVNPDNRSREGVSVTVKTDDGQTQKLHLAPRAFLQNKGIDLSEGDKITASGSTARIQGEQVLMVRELELNGQTHELRSQAGEPQWDKQGEQSSRQTMTGPERQMRQQDQQDQQTQQQKREGSEQNESRSY